MGYTIPGGKEIYDLDEITETFSLSHLGNSGAFFDMRKLDWLNQHYLIHSIPEDRLWERLKQWSFSDEKMAKIMPLIHTRIKTFGEFIELCSFLFVNHIQHDIDLLCPKKITKEQSAFILQTIIWSMEKQDNWDSKGFETASHEIAKLFDVNHKKIVMPLLFATITGKHHGPPLYASVDVLGKDRTRARLLQAIEFLEGISNKKLNLLKSCWERGNCKTLMD